MPFNHICPTARADGQEILKALVGLECMRQEDFSKNPLALLYFSGKE